MSVDELSTILSCSINDIKAWEEGKAFPDIMMLPKIASIFNVSIDYLTSGEIDTHKNYDQILNKVSKTDDVSLLDEKVIKGVDKKNNSLIDYVIKNESVKIFSHLINNNLLKYTFSNKDIKDYEDDLIYLATITNNLSLLPQIGINDIASIKKWPKEALKAIISDNRVNDNEINLILSMHKRNIDTDEFKYMPNDSRHVKGFYQITYIDLLDEAINLKNINFMFKLYNAISDANSYAIELIKKNDNNYKFFNTPLDRYQSQNIFNVPVVEIPYNYLERLLENKFFSILRYFNSINKQIGAKYIDSKIIDEAELIEDSNATDMDILRIKYIKNELLNIKEMLNSFTSPTKYQKQLLLNMMSNSSISYIELVNNYLLNHNYKAIFEFSIDYELNNLSKLIMAKKYDEIIPHMISILGYNDVLNDGHIKELKEKIKDLTKNIKTYEEENNTYQIKRCYEKISKLIEDEKQNWSNNLLIKNTNLNKKIYKEMIDTELECISFSILMQIKENNVKEISDNYKIKLYNEYLRKVGKNNE